MIVPADLHPADLAARIELRNKLVNMRHQQRMSWRQLGQLLDVTKSAVGRMEQQTVWRVSRLQQWAHALNTRLVFEFDGLPSVDVSMFRPTHSRQALVWDRRALLDALKYAREHLSVSTHQLAAVIGCSEATVRRVEAEDDVLLVTAQRHCRGLGGVLVMSLNVDDMPYTEVA